MTKLEQLLNPTPFSLIFKKLQPEQFVSFFRFEMRRLKVFLLSFCHDKEYILKVLELSNDQELTDLWVIYQEQMDNEILNSDFIKYLDTSINMILKNSIKFEKNNRVKMDLNVSISDEAQEYINELQIKKEEQSQKNNSNKEKVQRMHRHYTEFMKDMFKSDSNIPPHPDYNKIPTDAEVIAQVTTKNEGAVIDAILDDIAPPSSEEND